MKRIHIVALAAVALFLGQTRAMASLPCSSCAYVTGGNAIDAWDPTTNTLTNVLTVSGSGTTLDSLVFDGNGNIVFDDSNSGKIWTYNPTSKVTTLLTTIAPTAGAGASASIADIALEPSLQSILVAARSNKIIYRVNLNTGNTSVFYSGLAPDGIVYDNTGRLFAALGNSEVVQFDTDGSILKTVTGINGADGLTFSTTTLKLYVASQLAATGGFYTIPTDLSSKVLTTLPGSPVCDGVGTAGNFLYLIRYSNAQAIKYDLNTNQTVATSPLITLADDIAPLSGLGAPIAISVTPQTATLGASGTQSFSATVTGSNDTSVTWSLSGPGTLSNTTANPVTYTAPATIATQQTVTLTATSHADSSKTATATITLSPSGGTSVTITVAPQTATLGASATQSFTATVTGSADTAVTWSLSGPGTLSSTTANPVIYTAPSNVASQQTATLVATSHADSSKTAVATITLSPSGGTSVAITVAPQTATLSASGTKSFTATVTGSADTAVTWSLSGSGSLSNATANPVTYTAPTTIATQQTVTLTATSHADATKTAVATITLSPSGSGSNPVLTRLVVNPPASIVKPSDTISFTVQGFDQNGQSMSVGSVAWSLTSTNGSTINSNSGLYTAGPTPSTNLDTITAQSGSVQGTATVRIQNPGGFTITSINAMPNPVTGTSTVATVTASDSNNGTLTYSWSATGPSAVNFKAPNAAQSTAVFQAPGTYVLTAHVFSTTFPGVPLTASVSVTVVQTLSGVIVTPPSVTIFANQSTNFQAQVVDQFGTVMSGQGVNWSATGGQIGQSGALSSSFSSTPDLVNRTVIVTATAVGDSSKQGTGQVTIVPVGANINYDITNAHPYPVPWKSTAGIPYITFTGLAPQTDIKIYTTNARLVRHLITVNSEDQHWFVDNDNGERIGSGVYVYRITNRNSKQTVSGKLVIIQ